MPRRRRNTSSSRQSEDSSGKRNNRKRRRVPFDPNSEATGRFIVSIFRKDMRQAGRDIVDILGEILDKR